MAFALSDHSNECNLNKSIHGGLISRDRAICSHVWEVSANHRLNLPGSWVLLKSWRVKIAQTFQRSSTKSEKYWFHTDALLPGLVLERGAGPRGARGS